MAAPQIDAYANNQITSLNSVSEQNLAGDDNTQATKAHLSISLSRLMSKLISDHEDLFFRLQELSNQKKKKLKKDLPDAYKKVSKKQVWNGHSSLIAAGLSIAAVPLVARRNTELMANLTKEAISSGKGIFDTYLSSSQTIDQGKLRDIESERDRQANKESSDQQALAKVLDDAKTVTQAEQQLVHSL
jgi:hypothetical protein